MEKRLIARGLVAGLVGAVLAFVFARLFAEPVIGRAIAYEDGRTAAEQASGVHEHGIELFTRAVQANAGLGFGVLLFGVAMGALFAVLFCLAFARAKNPVAERLSVWLAAAVFVAVYLVPFVKYPPNPPAVGQSDTIGMRTGWYLVAVVVSVLLAIAAVWLARRLTARLGGWSAGVVAAETYVVTVALVYVLLPNVAETPQPLHDAAGVIIYPGFPADVLYDFRLVSLGTQLVLWVAIGLLFGRLAGRLLGEGAEIGRASSITA